MISAAALGQCSQSGCDAGETGTCIENLRLEDCPHFTASATAVPEGADSVVLPTDEELVPIEGGIAMSIDVADAFLRIRQGTIVALVGGPGVGKTTLIASLYELVRLRRLGEVRFAGCDTIRAFEERCHLSRTASGREQPDTQRTPRKAPPEFLHLKLAAAIGTIDLLLSDRTGEDYVEMLDAPSSCRDMPELMRCDCISLLVDGAQLTAPGRRHIQVTRTRRLWRALAESAVLGSSWVAAQVVLTKLDILQASPEADRAAAAFDSLAADLRRDCPEQIAFSEHRIASRPTAGPLAFGVGLSELVQAWLPEPEQRKYSDYAAIFTPRSPYERIVPRVGR